MKIGFVGLGKMGASMVRRLRDCGNIDVVGFDPDATARKTIEGYGATSATSLQELVAALPQPRAVWIMVPAGDITESTVTTLLSLLQPDDIIIDGGNSKYTDSVHHYNLAHEKGVHFIDAGTSGGIWGYEVGYCLMAGGDHDPVERMRPVLETLAPPDGFLHVGGPGSGHYVKMIHNGIEYGMLQAYAEGFAILDASPYDVDLHAIAHLWNQGSVVRSWLLELAERAFAADPNLSDIRGFVVDSGEGKWTVDEAIALDVPAPVIALSLMARYQSRQPDGFSNKVIAALRQQFGGHAVKSEKSS